MSLGLREVIERERVSHPGKERLFAVLGLLLTGRISMGKAAELLGLRVDELWLLLQELGVRYSAVDEEAEEIDAYKRVFEGSTRTSPIIVLAY